jgi:hypothetical protein
MTFADFGLSSVLKLRRVSLVSRSANMSRLIEALRRDKPDTIAGNTARLL